MVPFPESVRIDPLRNPDTVQQLQEESEIITAFSFRMPGAVGEQERGNTPPFVRDVLEDTLKGVGVPKSVTVSVVLDPRGDMQEQSDRLLSTAAGLVNGPGGDLVELAKVKYRRRDDGAADEVDLLKQRVAMQVDVDVDEATDRASESTASRGLATAYDTLRREIERALQALQ